MIEMSRVVEFADAREEQVLRALYDGAASARECAARLAPYARFSPARIREVEGLLRRLVRLAYLDTDGTAGETRYSLTLAGSAHLADLAE